MTQNNTKNNQSKGGRSKTKRRIRNIAHRVYNAEYLPGSMPSEDPMARPSFIRPASEAGRKWTLAHLNPNGHHNASDSLQGRIPDGTMKRTGIFNIHGTLPITNPFIDEAGGTYYYDKDTTPFQGEGISTQNSMAFRKINTVYQYDKEGVANVTEVVSAAPSTWSLFVISSNTMFMSHYLVAASGTRDSVPPVIMQAIANYVNGDKVIAETDLNKWIKLGLQGDDPSAWCFAIHSENEFKNYLLYTNTFENMPTSDFLYLRQTYKGDTYRYAGSTLNNEGMVTAASFPTIIDTSILPYDYDPIPASRNLDNESEDGSASDVSDRVSTSTDQVDRTGDAAGPILEDAAGAPYPYKKFIRTTFIQPPLLDVNQNMLCDQKAFQGRAEHGVYTINFNTEANFCWHSTAEHRVLHMTDTMAPTMDKKKFGYNGLRDIVMSEYDVKVVIFTGLDEKTTIRLEYRRGVEYHSSPNGKYQSLQESAPSYDPVPMQAVKCVVMNMPSGFPASYNDFGFLGDILGSILPDVIKSVPVVGGVLAPAVGGLIHSIFGSKKQQTADPLVQQLLKLLQQLSTGLSR